MKYIIITSIFEPTEAVEKFSKLNGYQLIVVGDKKSPANWYCNNVIYLSVEDQLGMDFHLVKLLPFNHYCRKMLGYLYAIQNDASIIIDTDDDNIPKPNWNFPGFSGEFLLFPAEKGFINIYQYYSNQKIWPRGLPLNRITENYSDVFSEATKQSVKVGIWQGLADEDPDVDAIYRLTSNEICVFENKQDCVLGKGTLTPFNTQNTAIRKELFPLLYLPTYVTFRFTDILRGLIAQPIMWLYDYNLGFTNATVIQKRNIHDFMKDFESEVPMYLQTERVIELTDKSISASNTISDNLFNAYKALLDAGFIIQEEIKTLEAWLKDMQKILG
ncbi:MAG: STELLO glycosyltransferase family protein [Bacteroidales bacterium]